MTGKNPAAHTISPKAGCSLRWPNAAVAGAKQLGANIHARHGLRLAPTRLLLGESQSRALVTTRPENASAVVALFELRGVPARRIGTVGGPSLVVKLTGPNPHEFTWEIAALHRAWDAALDSYLA